ncbi:uncharacterized protein LOC132639495 [Lycium barbarum]|uniref:uncharacterized protein LOC132639495 n=1 Tax=Lycium barbarum TaxID=112863 RepID=UPI00293E8406|nr:uncharacterized protein LOC132639495 [Lycium barbarum]
MCVSVAPISSQAQSGCNTAKPDISVLSEDLLEASASRQDKEASLVITTYEIFVRTMPVNKRVFHVSMLKKFMGDPSLVVPTEIIGVKDSLSYEEIPLAIIDRQIRKLRTKESASVKVLWRNKKVEEATWEAEEDMKSRYPYLFEEQAENVEGN